MSLLLRPLLVLLPFLGALIVSAPPASGQNPGTTGGDSVIFFTEPNYRGEALKVEAGASVENLDRLLRQTQTPWTASISSVKVEGTARATVFTAPGYGGERLEIATSIPDLYAEARAGGTWDRAIASLRVTGRISATAPSSAPVLRPEPAPGTVVVVPPPAAPPPRVIVREPPRPRLDRRTAEMLVERAYREVLDRPADPDGLRRYRDRLMYEGWTERQVIEQLQRSPEARSIKADEAITRIYREVLGRDPDPNGLAHYRAKWRQGWTQGQIRDDLRRSHEGRDSRIREIITRAYREVLGRDPDPAGYENYARLMRERGYTERDIRRALMSGDEYRQRKKR